MNVIKLLLNVIKLLLISKAAPELLAYVRRFSAGDMFVQRLVRADSSIIEHAETGLGLSGVWGGS